MAKIHGFSDIEKSEKPKGQNFYNGGNGGVEFFSHGEQSSIYKETEALARRESGNQFHDVSKRDFIINVILYKNGFTVNDGPLRDYNSPVNKKFISDIKEGYIPNEFIQQAQTMNIAMNMTDSSTIMYSGESQTSSSSQPPQQTFKGTGHTLGQSNSIVFTVNDIVKKVDETQPTTNIRIRFVDGKQKMFKINKDWTVRDVYALAKSESGLSQFRLVVMPNRIIEMSDLTVVEAKVANSNLIQQK